MTRMTRSYIDSRLARRLRHGRKKQTGLVLGRSVFSIARRVRLPGRPAGASVGGYTAHASRPSRPSNREKKRVQCRSALMNSIDTTSVPARRLQTSVTQEMAGLAVTYCCTTVSSHHHVTNLTRPVTKAVQEFNITHIDVHEGPHTFQWTFNVFHAAT
ncbi:hypothetical protein J6590_043234 [Homalodisca vitripennis]|nr:hypothetical protein J6590_043234 [Homalodisca vitripennis]